MQKNNIITYRLNKNVKPSEVLMTIENLMKKHSAQYQSCLFKADVSIIEYEFEGVFHSNRKKNAIVSICKKHPHLEAFLQHINEDKGEGHIDEKISISNFSDTDYSRSGELDDSIIREIVTKTPRPYDVNYLELIFDGIRFSKGSNTIERIRSSNSGFGLPIGNYILYEHYRYDSEKHAYIYFSAVDSILADMRKIFFEFSEQIPGKYEGVEIQN